MSYADRFAFLEGLAEYLVNAEIPGDYAEFGVWEGKTFIRAHQILARQFPAMRFIAADSFSGLPQPEGVDALEDYTATFYAGHMDCSQADFRANLLAESVGLERVHVIPGLFAQSLTAETARRANLNRLAAVFVDCDLYASTLPVLDWVRPALQTGTVLAFDDWRCFRNLPDRGEQRACAEWLAHHRDVRLYELADIGWHGKAFTVEIIGV